MSDDKKRQSDSKDKAYSISANESFNERRNDVFNFKEVSLKVDPHSDKTGVDRKRKSHVTDDDEPPKQKLNISKFKGRESLFRVPKDDFEKPHKDEEDDKEEKFDKFAAFRNRQHHFKDDSKFKRPKPVDKNSRGHGRVGKNRMPDYVKHPEKYTKYSLEETEVLNNRSNSQAAFAFLRELDQRKRAEESKDEELEGPKDSGKIEFRKPKKSKELESSSKSDSSKESLEKNKTQKKQKKSTQMNLSHLMEEEDDNE